MIAVPLKIKNNSTLLSDLKKAQSVGDIVEIWFDEISKISPEIIEQIFRHKKKSFIYKVQNLKNVSLFVGKDIEYFDLDIKTSKKDLQKIKKHFPQAQIIISFHDFKKTPVVTELKKIAAKMDKMGADIIKIAAFARNFKDAMTLLNLLDELKKADKKAICLAMGEQGKITRMAGHLFGNYLTYAPLRPGSITASGQLTVSELKKIRTWLSK